MLTPGQLVVITDARGSVTAEVIHTEAPASLPAGISGAPEVDRVRAIMGAKQIVEVAMLATAAPPHAETCNPLGHSGAAVLFCACRYASGDWQDLQHQPITITPMEPAQ